MAEKLSQQPAAQIGSEADFGMVVQDGQTRRQTRPQLRAAILSAWATVIRNFLGAADAAAARSAISAIAASDNITGSAAKLTTPRAITTTGDAAWTVNFDGSAAASAALTLAASGVVAGSYGAVTVDAKGRVTAANPKLAWTSYTPTVTASSGTYTAASATGSHMVAGGICHFRIKVTITTKGTGSLCVVTLPFAALAGSSGFPVLIKGSAVNFVQGAGVISVALTSLLLTDYLGGDIITGDGVVVDIAGSYPIA